PPLLQKSELSTTKSLTHKSVGDHLGATLLIQFTTSRQALRFLAGVYTTEFFLKHLIFSKVYRVRMKNHLAPFSIKSRL
ncbi:MAG: hypothetical protein K0U86_08555, partial [Planctomycetes bacterium]|nr:hypothetical protein [Planctomycetota bacterium]MCH9724940.1 hypothetical protein [Planctomycetota bacterium]MCH9776899.1 hypothetical protein [Planctomycetota bacterium]